VAEATALLEVIQDQTFVRLERAYLDTWKGWQAALVEGGVAQPLQGATNTPAPASKAFQAAKEQGQRVLAEPSRRIGGPGNRLDPRITQQERDAGLGLASKLHARYEEDHEVGPWAINEIGGDAGRDILAGLIKAENAVLVSSNEQAVAGELLSLLSETWTPLMDHLNSTAKCVLNQERSPNSSQDEALKALRVHARLAVLERFRKALWYCDLVWSQVASEDAPVPPPRIKPAAPAPEVSQVRSEP
jgi:hypothetical protein